MNSGDTFTSPSSRGHITRCRMGDGRNTLTGPSSRGHITRYRIGAGWEKVPVFQNLCPKKQMKSPSRANKVENTFVDTLP